MGAAWLAYLTVRRVTGLILGGALAAGLYALNPVVLYSFAARGHFDALHLFFLCAALLAYEKQRWKTMFLFFGLAAGIKYVALVAIPFFLRADDRSFSWLWGNEKGAAPDR